MDEKGSRGCNMDSIFKQDQGQCVVCVQSLQFFTSAVEQSQSYFHVFIARTHHVLCIGATGAVMKLRLVSSTKSVCLFRCLRCHPNYYVLAAYQQQPPVACSTKLMKYTMKC